jgi:large subunit ribosomal protein L13
MPTTQKTYSPKASEVTHAWRLVDAEGQTLGRLATEVATYLRGKHLPTFAEHLDLGDFVVVINASRIRVTGNKAQQRLYYRHSTYPGGLKSVPLGDLLARHPERVIKHTVRGMLPHTTLGRKMLRKLKVYSGPEHPHAAQFRAFEKAQRTATGPAEEQPA